MQQAAASNWRAAAWWLERLAPETFAQPAEAVLGRREANRFVDDLIASIDEAVSNPAERERMHELLSAAMPSAMRRAWNYRQSKRKLGQAMGYVNQGEFERDRRAGRRPKSARRRDFEREFGGLFDDLQIDRDVERLFASLGQRVEERKEGN